MSTVQWRKKLGRYTLEQFELESPNYLNCTIVYRDEEKEASFCFVFESWGMDPELITEEMAYQVCQSLVWQNCNAAISSFYDNFIYAQLYFDDEVEIVCPNCDGTGDIEELASSCSNCNGTGYID